MKASPEASLVWAGVCAVLPLLTNAILAKEANETGFTYVTSRMRYYVAIESLLLPEKEGSGSGEDMKMNFETTLYNCTSRLLTIKSRVY